MNAMLTLNRQEVLSRRKTAGKKCSGTCDKCLSKKELSVVTVTQAQKVVRINKNEQRGIEFEQTIRTRMWPVIFLGTLEF